VAVTYRGAEAGPMRYFERARCQFGGMTTDRRAMPPYPWSSMSFSILADSLFAAGGAAHRSPPGRAGEGTNLRLARKSPHGRGVARSSLDHEHSSIDHHWFYKYVVFDKRV
jgi:hypothetical protein